MSKRHYTNVVTWSSDMSTEYNLMEVKQKVQKTKKGTETIFTDTNGVMVGYFCMNKVAVSAINGDGWILLKNKPKGSGEIISQVIQVD